MTGGNYKLSYLTPDGQVNVSFMTKEGLTKHRERVINEYGENAVQSMSGPNINEGRQLLTESGTQGE